MQQVDGPGLSLGAWGGGSLPSDRAFLSGRPLVLLRLDTRVFVYVGEGGGDRPQPGLSPAASLPETLSKPSSRMGKRTQSGGSERGSREGICLGGQDLNRPHLSSFHLDHLISIFPTHFLSLECSTSLLFLRKSAVHRDSQDASASASSPKPSSLLQATLGYICFELDPLYNAHNHTLTWHWIIHMLLLCFPNHLVYHLLFGCKLSTCVL